MDHQPSDQSAPQAEGGEFNRAPQTSVYTNSDRDEKSPTPPDSVTQPGLLAPDIPTDQPVPVVQVLSVKGVEYTMMTLSLWLIASSFIWTALSLLNGLNNFAILSFPISLLVVCVPVFAFFFLRLRKAELANPALRFDASKRRLSQFTQVIAFAACLFNTIGFVYVVLGKINGTGSVSIGKALLNLLVVLAVAGGILAYYWFDEHKLLKG